jgi:hypothetical protein
LTGSAELDALRQQAQGFVDCQICNQRAQVRSNQALYFETRYIPFELHSDQADVRYARCGRAGQSCLAPVSVPVSYMGHFAQRRRDLLHGIRPINAL